VSATIGPTAGVDINSLAMALARASARTCCSKALNSRTRTTWSDSSTAAIVSRFGWPATSVSIRAAKLRSVVLPTLSPKPRRMPRRLFSTSCSFAYTSLRAVSTARVSWVPINLPCTGRNQPHRRGDPAGIVAIGFDRHRLAGIARRVSKSSTARPACHMAAESHCDRPGFQPDPCQVEANQAVPPARWQPCPREQPCRSHRQRTCTGMPMPRRFLHMVVSPVMLGAGPMPDSVYTIV